MAQNAMLNSGGYSYTPQEGWAIQQQQQQQMHPQQQMQMHPQQHQHPQPQQPAGSANTISSAFGLVQSTAATHPHPHFTSMYAGWY